VVNHLPLRFPQLAGSAHPGVLQAMERVLRSEG
jgi:hypothetical protein